VGLNVLNVEPHASDVRINSCNEQTQSNGITVWLTATRKNSKYWRIMINFSKTFLAIGLLSALGTTPATASDVTEPNSPLVLESLFSELASEPIYGETALELLEQLKTKHYASIEINDNFSSLLFDQYLDALDGSKLYFLAEDVQKIARYRYTLDNSLSAGNVEPGFEIYNLYHKRVIERLIYSIDRIENAVPQMDFTIDEYLLLDRENEPFAANTAELDEVWRKRIKNSVLSLRLTGDDEEEIVEKLSKRYRNQLSQVLKTNGKDVFQTYLSKVAATVDPHTSYFSPRDSENFNMGLSLSLQGIGAQLTTEDEYTKVVELIKGGLQNVPMSSNKVIEL